MNMVEQVFYRLFSIVKLFVTPRLKLKMLGVGGGGGGVVCLRGPQTWKSLPKDLAKTALLETFKRRLKAECTSAINRIF